MSKAILKKEMMQITKRPDNTIAPPRPALSTQPNSHKIQVEKAFDRCFQNNEKGLELLSKI